MFADLHAGSGVHVQQRRAGRRRPLHGPGERRGRQVSASCPVVYRDFKNESVSGGHPDFFYLGATVASPPSITGVDGQAGATTFNKRYCVPNSSGPAKKNDSTRRCWDLAQASLGANGKPAFNMARTGAGGNPLFCDCQFIDWSHDTNGGHVPGDTMAESPTNGLVYTNGASGHPMYRGPAPVVSRRHDLRPVVGRRHVHGK